MKYVVTAGDMNRSGLWDKFCEVLGLNPWGMNEGAIQSTDEFLLTEDQASKIGIISKGFANVQKKEEGL